MKKIKITTEDGFELAGIYNKVPNSQKGVMFAHGMTVNKDDERIFVRTEPKLNKEGFSTLRFDFRAHGESQGNSVKDFTISGEIADLEAVVRLLRQEGIKWLGLAGASFGGGIAALYAGRYPENIDKLFLANPLIDYERGILNPTTSWAREHFKNVFQRIDKEGYIKVGSRQFRVGRKLFEEMCHYNPCEELKKYNKPLLIVHGTKDDKVAVQDVKACYNNLPNEKKELKILEGAEHGFHTEPYETQVVEMIVDFFGGSIKGEK